MTGKRMKKLLMAKGISRNMAEYVRKNLRLYSEVGVMWTNAEKAERILAVEKNKQTQRDRCRC